MGGAWCISEACGVGTQAVKAALLCPFQALERKFAFSVSHEFIKWATFLQEAAGAAGPHEAMQAA